MACSTSSPPSLDSSSSSAGFLLFFLLFVPPLPLALPFSSYLRFSAFLPPRCCLAVRAAHSRSTDCLPSSRASSRASSTCRCIFSSCPCSRFAFSLSSLSCLSTRCAEILASSFSRCSTSSRTSFSCCSVSRSFRAFFSSFAFFFASRLTWSTRARSAFFSCASPCAAAPPSVPLAAFLPFCASTGAALALGFFFFLLPAFSSAAGTAVKTCCACTITPTCVRVTLAGSSACQPASCAPGELVRLSHSATLRHGGRTLIWFCSKVCRHASAWRLCAVWMGLCAASSVSEKKSMMQAATPTSSFRHSAPSCRISMNASVGITYVGVQPKQGGSPSHKVITSCSANTAAAAISLKASSSLSDSGIPFWMRNSVNIRSKRFSSASLSGPAAVTSSAPTTMPLPSCAAAAGMLVVTMPSLGFAAGTAPPAPVPAPPLPLLPACEARRLLCFCPARAAPPAPPAAAFSAATRAVENGPPVPVSAPLNISSTRHSPMSALIARSTHTAVLVSSPPGNPLTVCLHLRNLSTSRSAGDVASNCCPLAIVIAKPAGHMRFRRKRL